jgi:hypothetical protein
MKFARRLCLIIVALASLEASAQTDDAAYCGQLYALTRKYISGTCSECRPDLNIEGAAVDCRKGNFTKSIPYLEKRLRENRISLPQR